MDPMSESSDDAPRSRSLRARQSNVNYHENADDGDEDHSAKASKEKKRGSKRKAEMTIESLYCQENVKEVNPSSLETIFESPKKEQSRSRSTKYVENLATEGQLMSLRKLKRFCSFSDFYNPPKQKIKARKDRAKKHKQLTGVKVPKGGISNQALITALSVLSEEEDYNESITSDICKETFRNGHHVKSMDDDSSSFYDGNVIRPDTEDATMNEVIKNISMMHMENGCQESKDVLSHALCKDLEESLLFSNENENPNLQGKQSHQKKSRRRSQKFCGSLLPPVYANCEGEECTDLKSNEASILEGSAAGNLSNITVAEENVIKDDLMNSVSNTPKRRNVLSDQKVVKKTKRLESSLKRESEYADQKCLKKRGNLKGKIGKFYDGHSSNDVYSELSVDQVSKLEKEVLVSPHSDVKVSVTVKGKTRGKRRVSGINRPLYRLAPESAAHEKELNDSDSFSSDHLHTQALVTQTEGSTAVLASLEQNISPNLLSSTSPCSQMAALSLKSPDIVQQEKSRTRRQSERIRRNSLKLSMGSQNGSATSSSLESSVVVNNELDSNKTKVQKKKGRRLSSIFSELELRTEGINQSICQSVACENLEKDSLHSDLYGVSSSTDPVPFVVSTSSESVQTIDPVIDKLNVNQPCFLGDCSSKASNELVFSELNLHNENSANNPLDFQKQTCDDATHTAEQGDQRVNETHVMNVAKKSKSYVELNPAMQNLGGVEHCSPVLTGMFENKIGIRLGKIYCNKETLVSNHVTL